MSYSLEQIDEGVKALVANAAELVDEAEILHSHGSYARAFALAHFAREELSKSTMLYSAGARLIAQKPVDWKRLNQRLRDHKAKLRLETVMIAMFMKANGETQMSDDLLSGKAIQFAEVRNDDKNAALYVGFEDGRFILPRDTRNERQSERTIELAKMMLTQALFIQKKARPLASRAIGSSQIKDYDDPAVTQQGMELAIARFGALMEAALDDAESEKLEAKED